MAKVQFCEIALIGNFQGHNDQPDLQFIQYQFRP